MSFLTRPHPGSWTDTKTAKERTLESDSVSRWKEGGATHRQLRRWVAFSNRAKRCAISREDEGVGSVGGGWRDGGMAGGGRGSRQGRGIRHNTTGSYHVNVITWTVPWRRWECELVTFATPRNGDSVKIWFFFKKEFKSLNVLQTSGCKQRN